MPSETVKLTADQQALLEMFRNPLTYAVEMNRDAAAPLVSAGLLEWLPPMWGNTPNYGITDAGRALISARGDAQ